MAIDRQVETLRPLNTLAKTIPGPSGNHISAASLKRWALRGVLAPSGERIYLDVLRVGSTICSTSEALDRFLASLNGSSARDDLPAPSASPSEARARRASRELERLGV